jgi:hypothetical protein
MDKESSSRIQAYEASEHTLEEPTMSRPMESRTNHGIQTAIVAVAIVIVMIAAIVLLTHPNNGADVRDSGSSGTIETASTSGLLNTMEVKAGGGKLISNGGVSESDTITFSGYYSGGYSTDLRCELNGSEIYCDGSDKTIPGLGEGTYTLEIFKSGSAEKPLSFTWTIV